jgi:hypothetical protein
MNERRKHVVSVSPKLGTSGGGSRTLAGLLKDADPAVDEGPLTDLDAQRMRRVIVDAARDRTSTGAIGWKTSWAALALVVTVSAVAGIVRWREPHVDAPMTPTSDTAPATHESRRQLQFVAPGGTRVIWVFNADFKP